MRNATISVHGIAKSYGKTAVLKGVDFEIAKGSVFCLLGSNGAGKTTIVRILATLIKADGGEAILCGLNVHKQAAQVRRLISLTGQYTAVDELLTARENLIMTAKLFHVKDSKNVAAELLQKINLADVADKKVSQFSGGMRRRLDIAMSLTGDPAVLFLDEPTTGLDPQSRIEMWSMIRELSRSGVTIFLTTQYLEEAEQLADKIAILHEGKIIKEGTPEQLKTVENTLLLTVKTSKEKADVSKMMNGLDDVELLSVERQSERLEDVFLRLVGSGVEK
ncbi:MAG: ATP-binding cassette domain-containing protein [Oscillospiraceae bacterium]|jgi:ABC-2 type transport system ATP-binding protein|nr:ATP-binding cassette domain-containing protein [Oscillospiraceae bacterium]